MAHISLAATLKMYPQTRKVLAHLEQRGSISPLEAFGTYRITRLAARIKELRDVGFNIVTDMREDAAGTRYASYQLAPRT